MTFKERSDLEDVGVDGRIIIGLAYGTMVWTGYIWFGVRYVAGFCERVDEHLNSSILGEFLVS